MEPDRIHVDINDCGGINPYTLMGRHGLHHERWSSPQDEDVQRTMLVGMHRKATKRYCTKLDTLLVTLSLHSIKGGARVP